MTAIPTSRLLLAAAICAVASLAAAQAADPLAGTWRLNVAKSNYQGGTLPKSQTTTLHAMDGVLHESV